MDRAIEIMDATRRYMRAHDGANHYTIQYDEADCDGLCLADDCDDAIEALRSAKEAGR